MTPPAAIPLYDASAAAESMADPDETKLGDGSEMRDHSNRCMEKDATKTTDHLQQQMQPTPLTNNKTTATPTSAEVVDALFCLRDAVVASGDGRGKAVTDGRDGILLAGSSTGLTDSTERLYLDAAGGSSAMDTAAAMPVYSTSAAGDNGSGGGNGEVSRNVIKQSSPSGSSGSKRPRDLLSSSEISTTDIIGNSENGRNNISGGNSNNNNMEGGGGGFIVPSSSENYDPNYHPDGIAHSLASGQPLSGTSVSDPTALVPSIAMNVVSGSIERFLSEQQLEQPPQKRQQTIDLSTFDGIGSGMSSGSSSGSTKMRTNSPTGYGLHGNGGKAGRRGGVETEADLDAQLLGGGEGMGNEGGVGIGTVATSASATFSWNMDHTTSSNNPSAMTAGIVEDGSVFDDRSVDSNGHANDANAHANSTTRGTGISIVPRGKPAAMQRQLMQARSRLYHPGALSSSESESEEDDAVTNGSGGGGNRGTPGGSRGCGIERRGSYDEDDDDYYENQREEEIRDASSGMDADDLAEENGHDGYENGGGYYGDQYDGGLYDDDVTVKEEEKEKNSDYSDDADFGYYGRRPGEEIADLIPITNGGLSNGLVINANSGRSSNAIHPFGNANVWNQSSSSSEEDIYGFSRPVQNPMDDADRGNNKHQYTPNRHKLSPGAAGDEKTNKGDVGRHPGAPGTIRNLNSMFVSAGSHHPIPFDTPPTMTYGSNKPNRRRRGGSCTSTMSGKDLQARPTRSGLGGFSSRGDSVIGDNSRRSVSVENGKVSNETRAIWRRKIRDARQTKRMQGFNEISKTMDVLAAAGPDCVATILALPSDAGAIVLSKNWEAIVCYLDSPGLAKASMISRDYHFLVGRAINFRVLEFKQRSSLAWPVPEGRNLVGADQTNFRNAMAALHDLRWEDVPTHIDFLGKIAGWCGGWLPFLHARQDAEARSSSQDVSRGGLTTLGRAGPLPQCTVIFDIIKNDQEWLWSGICPLTENIVDNNTKRGKLTIYPFADTTDCLGNHSIGAETDAGMLGISSDRSPTYLLSVHNKDRSLYTIKVSIVSEKSVETLIHSWSFVPYDLFKKLNGENRFEPVVYNDPDDRWIVGEPDEDLCIRKYYDDEDERISPPVEQPLLGNSLKNKITEFGGVQFSSCFWMDVRDVARFGGRTKLHFMTELVCDAKVLRNMLLNTSDNTKND